MYIPRRLSVARWLLPIVVVLVVLEIASFPYVLNVIYSNRFVSPDRMLAYVGGRIESGDGYVYNGAGKVQLDLFDTEYDGVQSDDKFENVVAPGTKGSDTVQLQNRITGEVVYTAVFYIKKDDEKLPINVNVVGEFTDTDDYVLPKSVSEDQVFRAITGTLAGGEILNFDIEWEWLFDRGEEGDEIDNLLGNKEELDDIAIGVDITIEDENEYVLPLNPDTQTAMYTAAVVVSVVLLIILLVIVIA